MRLLAIALIILHASAGLAQESYPAQTVKFIVPAPAGSTTDILARVVSQQLGNAWKQAAIVENVSGGAMNIGARQVARAPADGYTLFIAPPAPLSYSDVLYRNTGYEPSKFVAVALLAKIPNVLVARKDLPVSSLAELIAYAKANPGKVSFGSGGVGTTAHLAGALLETRAGIKLVHVPYRGSQPAMTDLLAGNIDIFFETLAATTPLYQEHAVKVLAIADEQRAEAMPDVPTMSEAGLVGYKSITWFGLVAPPGTPGEIADKLARDTRDALNQPEVRTFLRNASLTPGTLTRAETTAFFAAEAALWTGVIKEAGVEPQ